MVLNCFNQLNKVDLSPLDLLPAQDLREKIVDVVLRGVPDGIQGQAYAYLADFRKELLAVDTTSKKVIVFGGGTGLSNIIGGDSRLSGWPDAPFGGLKALFPLLRSVVCVTDDGGSTGELLKDLPMIALGDIRHVLLSSIQPGHLQKRYTIDGIQAKQIASILSKLFNWRYKGPLTKDHAGLEKIYELSDALPRPLAGYMLHLIGYLFEDKRLAQTLKRNHCFGNLLVAAAIIRETSSNLSNAELASDCTSLHYATLNGLNSLGGVIGSGELAVLPCNSTPARLRVLYTNGVEILGENRMATSKRGFPVDGIQVDFCENVSVHEEIFEYIQDADIIIFAPGSLYSSIIPVFKVPRLAEAVRSNNKALKVLVSNLWVQAGETDLSIADPERKFHVSDMLRAYEKNIPGGTSGLFNEVLSVSLKDIPASILQSYAVEGKVPIYLDREEIIKQNFYPVECDIYSKTALSERDVIQHDPDRLAQAINALYAGRYCFGKGKSENSRKTHFEVRQQHDKLVTDSIPPFLKFERITRRIAETKIHFSGDTDVENNKNLDSKIVDIIWSHPVIPLRHLAYFKDMEFIGTELWDRDQRWDNVFSFYDPEARCIKIRADQMSVRKNLEIALMIAIGESLLGDYAAKKEMAEVYADGLHLGNVYHLHLQPEISRNCFFTAKQLEHYLLLSRMSPTDDALHYTRLVSRGEGFTPPGLLMGLMYAWYVDNRLATNIDYKMSVLRINQTNLIPEQLKMAGRREDMVDFFRTVVFNQS